MTDFNFLFRQDKGAIGRATWLKAVIGLGAVWGVLFTLYDLLARGDITKVGLTALLTIATIMLVVCYYFVSAKRFQDIGKPGALALVLPLMLLFDAAIHWMQPRLGATFPGWLTYIFDVVLIAMVIWNIWDLGCRKGKLS